jgi:CheY-like chemotaxis protein
LTHQLLAFSRKQVLQPRLVDLAELVQETGRMLQRLLGETVQLDVVCSEGLAPVLADPTQLEQIVVNLALNGRDAMPRGGRLTIELTNVHLDATYAASHASVTPGPYVMLAVTDTGVGMDEETRQRAFEPFFTTKALGKGTGLGLSTVYGIVKQSGGNIWIYSEPGRGTSFKVYLPAAEGAVREAVPGPETTHVRAGGSETILLVEDDSAVRGLTRTILERAGYLVLEASSPSEAETVFGEHSDSIGLLVTDLVMPGSNGQELFRRLAGRRASLKVLFMSGYSDDVVVRDGGLDPELPFIEKPFTAVGFARKVREALDR